VTSRAVAIAGVLLTACVSDLGNPTFIDETRVLAARAEVTGMPGVAWPVPGEEIRVEIVVVDEVAPRPIGFRMEACVESDPRIGASDCEAPPFAEEAREVPDVEDPAIALIAPDADRVLVRGVVCAGSAPAGLDGCRDARARPIRFRYSIHVVRGDEERNRNPQLAEARFGDEAWPASPLPLPVPGTPCDASVMAVARAGGEPIELSVAVTPESTESFLTPDEEPEVEVLQVSHHATAGALDQAFSFITSPEQLSQVRWTPPGEVAEAGVLVGLWHVVLDHRGGTWVVERWACVTR